MLTRHPGLIRLRTTPAPLVLLLAAGCIGFGNFYSYGAFNDRALALVAAGTAIAAAAMLTPRLAPAAEGVVPHAAVLVLVVWQGLTLVRATTIYGHGHALSDARYLSIALPTVAVAAVVTTGRASNWWWRLLVLGFAVGSVATIRASPRPRIDVWYLVQHASGCVLHGCNPYTLHTPQSPQVQDGYPYLPGSAVLLAPLRLLLSDARYGEALGIVVAAIVMRRCAGARGAALAPLMLCVPGIFFEVEQAWVESLLIALLAVPAALALRRRGSARMWLWTGLALGIAVASKQHIALLLPVAAIALGLRAAVMAAATGGVLMLPYFAVDPSAFWHNTVRQFVDQVPRVDSLSLWLHESSGARTALTVTALVVAYVLVWLACRGLPHRFLAGSGVVLAAFDLTNKSSFYDQWVLVTWLLLAGAALELRQPRNSENPASSRSTSESSL